MPLPPDEGNEGLRELILYAVPVGALANQIAVYFGGLATEAQRFPPHCTLTGFFHDEDVDRYVVAAAAAAAPSAVAVTELRTTRADWIGLELRSPDLLTLSARFADVVADRGTRRDDVRVKEWLHVSLAYGHETTCHGELSRRAVRIVDPSAAVTWELRLYERLHDGAWHVHGAWPL